MEEAFGTFKLTSSISEYNAAMKILHTYAKNIVNNPSNEKYRKIRVKNPKFNAAVWRFDAARMIMLLAGFEEEGEFLVLPSNIDLSYFHGLLSQKITCSTGSSSSYQNDDAVQSSSKQPVRKASTLKLFADKGASMFEEEIKADMTLLSYLVEMGYTKHVAEQGLIATKNKGVQPAMDWISAHPEAIHNIETKEASPASESNPTESTSNNLMGIMDTSPSQPSPSVSSRYGKYMDERHKYQEKMRLEAIKKAKIEKEEEKRAKLMLKKNLEAERNETKQKFQQQSHVRHLESENHSRVPLVPAESPADSTNTKIRIKLPDGKTEVWETLKKNVIDTLYQHVYSLLPNVSADDLKIISPSTHQTIVNDNQTLEDAGLCPCATVIVHRVQRTDDATPMEATPNTDLSDPEAMNEDEANTKQQDSNNGSIT